MWGKPEIRAFSTVSDCSLRESFRETRVFLQIVGLPDYVVAGEESPDQLV